MRRLEPLHAELSPPVSPLLDETDVPPLRSSRSSGRFFDSLPATYGATEPQPRPRTRKLFSNFLTTVREFAGACFGHHYDADRKALISRHGSSISLDFMAHDTTEKVALEDPSNGVDVASDKAGFVVVISGKGRGRVWWRG